MNKIPEEYLGTPSTWDKGGHRHLSSIERELYDTDLEDIPCPKCGEKHLRNMEYGWSEFPDYQVGCDNCGWSCHVPLMNDCGESIIFFKEWLAAYKLLGEPKDRLQGEDLTFEFYKEEDRPAEIENRKLGGLDKYR